MFFDLQYLVLTIPALIFSLWAQWKVRSTFHRFANVGVQSGYGGAQAAQAVLQSAGVRGVRVERHEGFLSDHYDPLAKALRLSPHVYDGQSIAKVAVAAHEAGHAIQDQVGYLPLVWRWRCWRARELCPPGRRPMVSSGCWMPPPSPTWRPRRHPCCS